nr:putative holin-like toxin [Bacillus subtilis]
MPVESALGLMFQFGLLIVGILSLANSNKKKVGTNDVTVRAFLHLI